jgi:hypothetical protein
VTANIPAHSLTECPCYECSAIRVAARRPQAEVLAELRARNEHSALRQGVRDLVEAIEKRAVNELLAAADERALRWVAGQLRGLLHTEESPK